MNIAIDSVALYIKSIISHNMKIHPTQKSAADFDVMRFTLSTVARKFYG